jgi:hypothetical protein
MWEAARCYKSTGDDAKARELLMALRSVDSYKSQADAELAEAELNSNMQAQNAAPPAAAPAGRAAAAAPAKPKAAAKEPAAADAIEAQPGAPSGQGLSAPARRSTQAGF